MGGNSDLERRIMRLEQALPGVRQRITKLKELNGANLQAIRMIRESVGDGVQPTQVSYCGGLILPNTLSGSDANFTPSTLTLAWDATLVFPLYSGGSIITADDAGPGGWSYCNTVSFPASAFCGTTAVASIAITYKLAKSGNLYIYWKTASPFLENSQPVTNTCGDVNTSDKLGFAVVCPSTGVAGQLLYSPQNCGAGVALWGAAPAGHSITITLPAL